jgi:REP element-mobilizing transposase RayT
MPGAYFVTVCTEGRRCFFGCVNGRRVELSRLGRIASECLLDVRQHHAGAIVDTNVVMPNHVHAVVVLTEAAEATLGTAIGTYKAAVSRRSRIRGLWQRGYYDHVIRDESELARIREYVETNPIRSELDPENPGVRPVSP